MNRKHNQRMSISNMIIIGLFVALVLFISFMYLYNYQTYSYFSERKIKNELLNNLQGLKVDINESLDSFSRYLSSSSIYKLTEFFDSMKKIDEKLSDLEKATHYGETIQYTFSSLKYSMSSYDKELTSAFNRYSSNNQLYYENINNASLIAGYMINYCDELLSLLLADDIEAQKAELASYYKNILPIIIFAFSILSFISFIIYVFSVYLYKPLTELAKQAERLSNGDFSAHVELMKSDQGVARLSTTFNTMAQDIKRMMEDLNRKIDAEEKLLEEKRKNLEYESMLDKATFLALQTQTNPHFLYNTLNSISRTITLGRTENAQQMLSSLSLLMRYNLSDSGTPAILKEEVEITEEYLRIQKLRFGERISYKIVVPEQFKNIAIPRFTLQPLVENSIIHGIEPKENGGKIKIDCKDRNKDIVLRIADNGLGIDKNKLDAILSNGKSQRIGIKNTRKRVTLFYANPTAFEIISKKNVGTMIIIHIPKEQSNV